MLMNDKKRILIVDDDEFLRGVYAKNFQDEGFEVLAAYDGQEAWEMIDSGKIPDIVFTGIVMPRMTGFELIAKMQADEKLKRIPVAVNSHRGRPEDQILAKQMNVDDFIIQGVTTPIEAVRRIKALLGIQNQYKVAIVPNKQDATAFVSFLNQQQGTMCDSLAEEILLEIEPKTKKGEFKINLKC